MRATVAALALTLFARVAAAQTATATPVSMSPALHRVTENIAQSVATADSNGSTAAYTAMLYQEMLLAYWLTAYYGSVDTSASASPAPTSSEDWFTNGAALTAMPAWYFSNGAALTNVPAATVQNGAMTQGAGTDDAAALTVDDRVPSTTPDGHRVSIYSVSGGRAAMRPEATTSPGSSSSSSSPSP